MQSVQFKRFLLLIVAASIASVASVQLRADTGTCGGSSLTLPFTDVPAGNIFFCAIAEAYFSALTNGTTPTTFSPSDATTREQMAAFVGRTLDQSLRRGSQRAALDQFWTPQTALNVGITVVGLNPNGVKSDGGDLWVADFGTGTVGTGFVSRVRASDGKLIDTWSGTENARGVLVAMGSVFVTGQNGPGILYVINPTLPSGAATIAATGLGDDPNALAFDGQRLWTANNGFPGSVSIITPASTFPWAATTISTGFSQPISVFFDGINIWVVDNGQLKRLNSSGAIIQTVNVGASPGHAVFDGTNIWVPNSGDQTITVVRASTGAVLATLSGNGLSGPSSAAFDGERILVTNFNGGSVSLWKATDLTPVGVFPIGSQPNRACSDGVNFWVTLQGTFPGKLARF